ncbi:G-box-binding factor 4-like isoform X1 [Mangifera indica]|uniref:G-box-binding factor 4-like isoform X1 n=3 Tax=Mangifera indica TaxID=29780 RepID=UPI001CFA730A|nr:G-box-binding factor 4-like isoform X1 [Mangifera indica]
MMASSKVMTTTSSSTTNSDLSCQQSPLCPSLCSLLADLQNQQDNPPDPSFPNAMDDLLKNIYSVPTPDELALSGASFSHEGSFNISKDMANRSVEEVWKEMVAGGGTDQRSVGSRDEEMTLEDFLTKADAVREEDQLNSNSNSNNNNVNNVTNNNIDNNSSVSNYRNNQMVIVGSGRGKRRIVEEAPLDKATQQKQRRMIKNRESAARSRERKQAYTVELESLVTQLEEENARLLREEAHQNKERFKQLMENLIPVVEKRRPPRVLRRVHSLNWSAPKQARAAVSRAGGAY